MESYLHFKIVLVALALSCLIILPLASVIKPVYNQTEISKFRILGISILSLILILLLELLLLIF